jgi:hypothetical protein
VFRTLYEFASLETHIKYQQVKESAWTLAVPLLVFSAWWMWIHHEWARKCFAGETHELLAGTARRAVMAFIRKRGNIYYLVHNHREQGRVRQLYLARLGRKARIKDELIEEVMAKHPFVRVDWKRLREKASGERLQPLKENSRYLRGLLSAIRNVHLEIGDLQLAEFDTTPDVELRSQLTWELKLLQETLKLKLREFYGGKRLAARSQTRSANYDYKSNHA